MCKLNSQVKKLAESLGFKAIVKNIKVRSTNIDELAGYVILMVNYMYARFAASNQEENAKRVIDLLKIFLVQINFISTKKYEFPVAA